MVRLRVSWPFSLSSAPTVGNPCRPLQPESVSEQIVGRSEGWIGFMREPCPVPHRASSCDQRTRRSRASPCFALIGGAFCLGCPKHRLVVVLFVIGLAGLLEATQNLVPGRHGQMHDLTVKVFSAVIGALAAALLERTVIQAFSHKGRLSRS